MEIRAVNTTALSLINYRINVNPEILDIQKIIDISLANFKISCGGYDPRQASNRISKGIDILSPEERKKRTEEETQLFQLMNNVATFIFDVVKKWFIVVLRAQNVALDLNALNIIWSQILLWLQFMDIVQIRNKPNPISIDSDKMQSAKFSLTAKFDQLDVSLSKTLIEDIKDPHNTVESIIDSVAVSCFCAVFNSFYCILQNYSLLQELAK